MSRVKQKNIFLFVIGVVFATCTSPEDEYPCLICLLDFKIIDYEPAWSPDGKWIAFAHGDSISGKSGIYLISPDGSQIQQWHEQFAEAPAWSPYGRWIAFHRNGQIWKKKIDGDSLTQLTFKGRNFFPTWSPDGQWLAFYNTNCGSAVTPSPSNSCGIIVLKTGEIKINYLTSGRFLNWSETLIYTGLYYNLYEYNAIDSISMQLTSFNNNFNYRTVYYPKYSISTERVVFTSQQFEEAKTATEKKSNLYNGC